MLKNNLLAHRGMWKSTKTKNSKEALFNALDHGYGLETDLRDLNGTLVVSHDPASSVNSFPLEVLFDYYCKIKSHSILALNIKSDGLQTLLSECIARTGINIDNLFVFDMSVPDLYQYVQTNIPRYTRISDLEVQPILIHDCQGIWLDDFNGYASTIDKVVENLSLTLPIAIVSPELHGLCHKVIWTEIKRRELHKNKNLALCTDLPDDAYNYFKD